MPSGLQRKKAPLGAGLKIKGDRRSFIRRLVAVTAQGVDVRHAAVHTRGGEIRTRPKTEAAYRFFDWFDFRRPKSLFEISESICSKRFSSAVAWR